MERMFVDPGKTSNCSQFAVRGSWFAIQGFSDSRIQ